MAETACQLFPEGVEFPTQLKIVGVTMPRRKGQMGSVHLRSGSWYGLYSVYLISDGREIRKRKRVYLGENDLSRRNAKVKLLEIIQSETATQVPRPDGSCSFRWFWEQRYLPLKTKWSKNQQKTITGIFRLHVIPAIGVKSIEEINRFDLQMLLNAISKRKSKSIVDKVFTYLKAAFDEAVDMDFLQKSPARKLEMPTVKPVCKRHLSPEEIQRIWGAVTGRDRLIIRCLVSLALRPGELFALRWKDLQPGQVIIDEQVYRNQLRAPKTATSKAPVALPASIEAELLIWKSTRKRTKPDDFIFEARYHGRPMDPRRWQKDVLRPLGKKLGIPGLTFQSFRRTFATQALNMSKDVKSVQGQLRHSSPDLTAGEYAQVVDDSMRRVVEDFDQRFGPHEDKKERVN